MTSGILRHPIGFLFGWTIIRMVPCGTRLRYSREYHHLLSYESLGFEACILRMTLTEVKIPCQFLDSPYPSTTS